MIYSPSSHPRCI